jgi:uncharacterized protein involved in exopolysaccharide biosynthesis
MRKLGLYVAERPSGVMDDSLVAELRRSLTIAPVASSSRGQPGPVRIGFRGHDAPTAARVANHLAERFVQEVAQSRRASSGAAAQFLSTRAVLARQGLDQREAALRDFRIRYAEELPEQSDGSSPCFRVRLVN